MIRINGNAPSKPAKPFAMLRASPTTKTDTSRVPIRPVIIVTRLEFMMSFSLVVC